jgi:hypothetical protein
LTGMNPSLVTSGLVSSLAIASQAVDGWEHSGGGNAVPIWRCVIIVPARDKGCSRGQLGWSGRNLQPNLQLLASGRSHCGSWVGRDVRLAKALLLLPSPLIPTVRIA